MHPKESNPDLLSQHVLGHLLSALDDDEQQVIDARLEQDEALRLEFMRWRRQLAMLEALRSDEPPPLGLAQRTCRFVAEYRAARGSKWSGMSPVLSPPNWTGRTGWLDVSVVVLLLVATLVLLLPAINNSRFHARLAACQENIRQFGLALTHSSQQRNDSLSRLSTDRQRGPTDRVVADLFQAGFLSGTFQPADRQSDRSRQDAALARSGLTNSTQPVAMPTVASNAGSLQFGGLYAVALVSPRNDDPWLSARRVMFASNPDLFATMHAATVPTDISGPAWTGPLPMALPRLDNDPAFSANSMADRRNELSSHQGDLAWHLLFQDGHATVHGLLACDSMVQSLVSDASLPPDADMDR